MGYNFTATVMLVVPSRARGMCANYTTQATPTVRYIVEQWLPANKVFGRPL